MNWEDSRYVFANLFLTIGIGVNTAPYRSITIAQLVIIMQ